jgi:hypothetical protein
MKSFEIGEKKYYVSRERLDAEIAKCTVRCHNCHAIRTAAQAKGINSRTDWPSNGHVDPQLDLWGPG